MCQFSRLFWLCLESSFERADKAFNLASRISPFMAVLQRILLLFVPWWEMRQVSGEHNALVQSVLVSVSPEDLDKEVSAPI